jgi:hypothetical protein
MGAPAIFEKQIEIKLLHPASTEGVTDSGSILSPLEIQTETLIAKKSVSTNGAPHPIKTTQIGKTPPSNGARRLIRPFSSCIQHLFIDVQPGNHAPSSIEVVHYEID